MEKFTLNALATFVVYELLKLFLPFDLPPYAHPGVIALMFSVFSFVKQEYIVKPVAAAGVVSIISYLFGNSRAPIEKPGTRPGKKVIGIPDLPG